MQLIGKVEKVLVASEYDSHISKPAEKVKFIQGYGVFRDSHYGPRLIDVRDKVALRFGIPKGMEVFNTRQWSAVSQEDLDAIAHDMEIVNIDHGLFGENLVVSGIPNFTMLPIGTQFFFRSMSGDIRTTILYVTAENNPCHVPVDAIQACYPGAVGRLFAKNALHRRGLVGFVLGSGFVKEGDMIVVEVPEQRPYSQT